MILCPFIGEEGHANWIEAQLQQMGEAHDLAQQIKREDE
jgi:hypothetical protein